MNDKDNLVGYKYTQNMEKMSCVESVFGETDKAGSHW